MAFDEISNQIVLVHRRDGKIVHVHEVVTLAGGRTPDASELEKSALEHAAKNGHDVAELGVMHVDRASLKPGTRYHLDPAEKKLIATPAPPHRGR